MTMPRRYGRIPEFRPQYGRLQNADDSDFIWGRNIAGIMTILDVKDNGKTIQKHQTYSDFNSDKLVMFVETNQLVYPIFTHRWLWPYLQSIPNGIKTIDWFPIKVQIHCDKLNKERVETLQTLLMDSQTAYNKRLLQTINNSCLLAEETYLLRDLCLIIYEYTKYDFLIDIQCDNDKPNNTDPRYFEVVQVPHI